MFSINIDEIHIYGFSSRKKEKENKKRGREKNREREREEKGFVPHTISKKYKPCVYFHDF